MTVGTAHYVTAMRDDRVVTKKGETEAKLLTCFYTTQFCRSILNQYTVDRTCQNYNKEPKTSSESVHHTEPEKQIPASRNN